MRNILLPDGLETIEINCFRNSGLEKVVLPASIKCVESGAFCGCEQLKSVQLNEGLEKLGEKEVINGKEC